MDSAKKYIVIAAAVLIIGLITYFYFAGRAAGKRSGGGDKAKLPNSGSGIPKGWDPDPIVQDLYDAIKGASDDGQKKQTAFAAAYALTPDQLTAVYNEFNRQYQKGDKDRNLYNWINDEWVSGAPLLWGKDYRDLLLSKMSQLNLKPTA